MVNRLRALWLTIIFVVGGIVAGIGLTLFFQLHVSLSTADKLHRLLENLYFIASIAIAGMAAVGLQQLRLTSQGLTLTRQIAAEGQQREALKLASEQCRFYADVIVPAYRELEVRIQAGQFKHAIGPINLLDPPFRVVGGAITIKNHNLQEAQEEGVALDPLKLMNTLESFAIFFVSGMATDDVGYYETGIGFLQATQLLMPSFLTMRLVNNARYVSAVAFYERWQNRYRTEQLTFIRNNIDQEINRPSV